MGLKDFLRKWKNTNPVSFRTTYSVTCVEVVGSMGKGSHPKYHSRWSQEMSSPELTQTLTKCPGSEARSTIWVGCSLKTVTQQGWAHLKAAQDRRAECLLRPRGLLLAALLPAHPLVPPLGSCPTAQVHQCSSPTWESHLPSRSG